MMSAGPGHRWYLSTEILSDGFVPVIEQTGIVGNFQIVHYHSDRFSNQVRIAVNTVAPGAIATDFSGGMVRDNPEMNKRVAEMTALGRVGLPDDIGPMIASLLSEDNRWINGQRIEVSGGMGL
jgi:hypothetical protein